MNSRLQTLARLPANIIPSDMGAALLRLGRREEPHLPHNRQPSIASHITTNSDRYSQAVPDVDPKKIKLDVQSSHLEFSGYSQTKKAEYKVRLDFFKEIDASKSKINHTPRDVEMVLQKKELGEEYWPRLLKDKAKVHFLKTDFDKVGTLEFHA